MRRVLVILLLLVAAISSKPAVAQSSGDACENCTFLAGWYMDNTDMTMGEITDWLILCYTEWNCFETEPE